MPKRRTTIYKHGISGHSGWFGRKPFSAKGTTFKRKHLIWDDYVLGRPTGKARRGKKR